MKNFSSLLEALDGLKKAGYTEDINLLPNCLEYRSHKGLCKILSNEFTVDHYYRFEGDSNPNEQSIIYAISSEKYNLKGTLVNAHGIYSDPVTNEMMKALTIIPK